MKTISSALIMLVGLGSLAPAAFAADTASLRLHGHRAEGWTLQGASDDRWEWSPGGGLELRADSAEPSARVLAPLPFALDGAQNFRVEMDFTLHEVDASPDDFFQISLGLVNASTTGLNRTGTSLPVAPFFIDDADVFDSVEFAYFPNVTFFGGPFLQPAIFGAASGGSAFWNFAANFGPSSDLGDNPAGQIRELPEAIPLRFVMEHDACRQVLTTRVFDLSGKEPVELSTGLEPVDISVVNATGTFTVDAVAVNAYFDGADFDPSTVSLRARVHVTRASVSRRDAIEARVAPRAVNAAAAGRAHVLVSNAAAEAASVRLIEINGVASDEPLAWHAAGNGRLLVTVPREIAAAPFAIAVDGCRVDLAPERVIAP